MGWHYTQNCLKDLRYLVSFIRRRHKEVAASVLIEGLLSPADLALLRGLNLQKELSLFQHEAFAHLSFHSTASRTC